MKVNVQPCPMRYTTLALQSSAEGQQLDFCSLASFCFSFLPTWKVGQRRKLTIITGSRQRFETTVFDQP